MNDHLDITKASAKPVSRRNFIAMTAAGSAVVPAVALAEASGKTSRLPQLAAVQEDPWVEVYRLTDELSEALVHVDDGQWFAKVYPKSRPHGLRVMLGDIQAERDAQQVEPALLSLIEAHKSAEAALHAAWREVDDVALGREPTKAAQRRCKKADKAELVALDAILEYVPYNDASRYVKAKYLLPFTLHAQLCENQMHTLLVSMCGRSA